MKTFLLAAGIALLSFGSYAQKLTKAEKKHKKFCEEKTYTIEDPFSGKDIVVTKFSEFFGNKEEYIRCGTELWMSARYQDEKITVMVKITQTGAREGTTEKGAVHDFSMNVDGETKLIQLKTSEKSVAAARAVGNQYGVGTITDFVFKYELSDEEADLFRTGLLKGVKLKIQGTETLAVVDNEERAEIYQSAIRCFK